MLDLSCDVGEAEGIKSFVYNFHMTYQNIQKKLIFDNKSKLYNLHSNNKKINTFVTHT